MTSDVPSDAALIVAAATDPEAFGLLYDRYVKNVYAYVASRLSCRIEAEDVTSDVWMKILENLSRFRPRREESVIAWIFAIARNAVTDAHRRRRHESVDPEELVAIEDEGPDPARSLARRQEFLAVQERIDGLPPAQAQCIRLRYYAGLRNQEIAALEGLSEKTVAAHISRGMQAIRSATSSL